MLPTKVGNSPSDTEVQGTGAADLPQHGSRAFHRTAPLIVSFGGKLEILFGGASLLLLPGLTLQKAGGHRRH